MTSAVAALAGTSSDPEALCAAVRWVAPHVALSPDDDDLLYEALALGDGLCPEAEALWLWWLAQYRPDLVESAAYGSCNALPPDLRAVLLWVVEHGPRGLDTYRRAAEASQPYIRALRELTRAARDFRVLQEAVDAVQGGARDANLVMAQLPGGWSSAALQGGRKSLVAAAFAARDAAVAAGAPVDLPTVRLPRFSGLDGQSRDLCLDLLAGLPGSSGRDLLEESARPLPLPGTASIGEAAALCQQLRARGLPAPDVALDANFWLASVADAGQPWVAEIADESPGARVVRDLQELSSGSLRPKDWLASLATCEGYWSARQMSEAVEASLKHCVRVGAGAAAAEVLEALPTRFDDIRVRYLDAALLDFAVPDITLLAFNCRLRESLVQLAITQESLV